MNKKNKPDKKVTLPSISCIMATYNSSATIGICLKSLLNQEYPKDKIEIIVADGGSKDNTLDIVRKFTKKIHIVPPQKQEAEYNKGFALQYAKNDLVLLIDHDNVLPHKRWLVNMVKPLIENKEIIASEAFRFTYNRKDMLLDRYFALIGGIDTVPYYLGKDSKLSYAEKTYTLLGRSVDKGTYYEVLFEKNKIPTLGANGTLLRRNLLKYTKHDPENFFHIDIFYDLVKKGYKRYAFVKEDIIHFKQTKISYFIKFLIRRKDIMEKQYFDNLKKRRYAVFIPEQDMFRLFLYVLYTVTIIKPTYDAVRGFSKVRDVAWFVHPIVCWGFLLTYSWAVIARQVRKMMI